jgi:uncharacterized OB-fold protein
LRRTGGQCGQCAAIVVEPVSECPYCMGKLTPSQDVVNLAVQRAMDTGIKVSALDASPRLAEVGQIAAVLRY